MNQKELINLVIECVKTAEDDTYGTINYGVLKLFLKEEIPKQLTLTDVVKSFFCNNEKLGVRCTTQCLGCDGFERN